MCVSVCPSVTTLTTIAVHINLFAGSTHGALTRGFSEIMFKT